jgi:cytochrome c oxidase cbb3-type subunit 4
MSYEAMRQFADSWGLVFLVVVFAGVVIFVFRPGSRARYDDAASIPFKDRKSDRDDADD